MGSISVNANENQFVFSIERTRENLDLIISALSYFNLESMIKELNIDSLILDTAEEIKMSVWEKSRYRLGEAQ